MLRKKINVGGELRWILVGAAYRCASSISIGPVVANSWSVPDISSLGGLPFWGFFRALRQGVRSPFYLLYVCGEDGFKGIVRVQTCYRRKTVSDNSIAKQQPPRRIKMPIQPTVHVAHSTSTGKSSRLGFRQQDFSPSDFFFSRPKFCCEPNLTRIASCASQACKRSFANQANWAS